MPDPGKWLKDSFIQNMLELGATDCPDLADEADFLLRSWQASNRFFHSINYLRQMLDFLESLSDNVHDPLILQIATWYYGVFIDTREADDSEKRYQEFIAGAKYAQEKLPQLGLSIKQANKVANLILSLSDTAKSDNDNDGLIFHDASICYLGASPQDYREYRKMLREELSDLNDYEYAVFRGAFIARLLAQDPLFKSSFGVELEENARHNLESELAKLEKLANQENSKDTKTSILDTTEQPVLATEESLFASATTVLADKSTALMERIIDEKEAALGETNEPVNEQHQSSMEMVEDILDTLSVKKPMLVTEENRRVIPERIPENRERAVETTSTLPKISEDIVRKSIFEGLKAD